MSTVVEICNSALRKIGVKRISSLSEDSKAARACRDQYPIIRDSLLEHHYWNFAIKTVALAQLPDLDASGRGYKYSLPQDYSRAIRLMSRTRYKVESGELITQDGAAVLQYVWKNTNTFSYTAKFKEALAASLASDLAYDLVQSNTLATRKEREAKMLVLDAAATDAQEDYIDNIHGDDFIQGRYGEIQSFN